MLRLITLSVLLSSLLIAAPVAQAQSQDISSRIDPFWNTPIGPRVMVTLCHIPPGEPDNPQTIEVDQSAVPLHLAHGDSLGACPDEGDDCPANPSLVPKTGQTTSYQVGDDGEYQAGASVDPRFTDNGDGTVKDNLTGLIWLQTANCFGVNSPVVWNDALANANGLSSGNCGLTDGSVAGDWRLPNVKELQSLIDHGQSSPALPVDHPFSGVEFFGYWSSTTSIVSTGLAWLVDIDEGITITESKPGNLSRVWPVRGGL